MFPWQKNQVRPRYTLLLTRLGDGINIDRGALRQAGLSRLHSVSSGERALQIIREQAGPAPSVSVDLIVCTGELEDMSLAAFMRRLTALGTMLPVLLITPGKSEIARALSLGASAVLSRPYTVNELCRAVESLRASYFASDVQYESPKTDIPSVAGRPSGSVSNLALDAKANRSITASTSSKETKEEIHLASGQEGSKAESTPNKLLWTRTGLGLLREGKFEQARELLLGALDYDPLDLEAALGLSRLCQQQGEDNQAHRWVHRAALICQNTRQYERAEILFSRLPEKWQGDHEMIEAQELLLEGNYDAACEAFIDLCTSRKGMVLHRLLGRACQFTHAPEECMYELISALERNGYESTAQMLEARMLGDCEPREQACDGFLSHFPRLQEVVAVARFTAQAFRAS